MRDGDGTRSSDPNPSVAQHLGYLYRDDAAGVLRPFVDVAGLETTDTDQTGDIDSNPYSLTVDADGVAAVADAGASDLIRVAADGGLKVLSVFPKDWTATAPLPPNPQLPYQSVPDAVTRAPPTAAMWWVS